MPEGNLNVRVVPADDGGCGWYRLRHPARVLGIECQTLPKALFHDIDGQPMIRALDCDADVIVIQRPLQRETVQAIKVLQRQGTAVVVEIDDDFHALPPGHPARPDTDPANNATFNRAWLKKACLQADLVTVSTPALAERYAPHGRYAILPNLIPADYLNIRGGKGRQVGWTGSVATHVGDLEVTGGGVAQAITEHDSELRVVGTGKGVAERLGYTGKVQATGWVPIAKYPSAYSRMHVAVVPLALNPFNEAKSWLKGIEAAALGVPFVASPTSEYRRLHQLGAGRLAESPADWYDEVSSLLTDASYWEAQRAAGRETASHLTYEEHAWRWAEAWQEAIHHYRHRGVAA